MRQIAIILSVELIYTLASIVNIAAQNEMGKIEDNRDGKTYKTIVIGNKIWISRMDYCKVRLNN